MLREALGRYYVDAFGMSVICLRIGSFQPRPAGSASSRRGSATGTRPSWCGGGSRPTSPSASSTASPATPGPTGTSPTPGSCWATPRRTTPSYARKSWPAGPEAGAGTVAGGCSEPAQGPRPAPDAALALQALLQAYDLANRLAIDTVYAQFSPTLDDFYAEDLRLVFPAQRLPGGGTPGDRAHPHRARPGAEVGAAKGPLSTGAGCARPGRSPGGARCGCARGRSAGADRLPVPGAGGDGPGRDATPARRATVRSGAATQALPEWAARSA